MFRPALCGTPFGPCHFYSRASGEDAHRVQLRQVLSVATGTSQQELSQDRDSDASTHRGKLSHCGSLAGNYRAVPSHAAVRRSDTAVPLYLQILHQPSQPPLDQKYPQNNCFCPKHIQTVLYHFPPNNTTIYIASAIALYCFR